MNKISALGTLHLQIANDFHSKEVLSSSRKICIGIVQVVLEYIWFIVVLSSIGL